MENGDRLSAARDRVRKLESDLAAAREELRGIECEAVQRVLPSAGVASSSSHVAVDYAENGTVTKDSSPADKLAIFRSRFAGRADAYALPWVSHRTGKKGWSPAVRGGFYTDAATDRDLLLLTDAVIERHLRGFTDRGQEVHVGLYPLLPDDRTWLLACDFDDGDWRKDASAYFAACRRVGIDALAEISRSGEGAHVWIFFETPVPAASARDGCGAPSRSHVRTGDDFDVQLRPLLSLADTLPQRSTGRARPGNLIALPLQGGRRRNGTTVFAHPITWEPFADQFQVLSNITPIPVDRLAEFSSAVRLPAGPQDSLLARPRRAALRAAARAGTGRRVLLRRDAVVHVPTDGLPGVVVSALKHAASVSNPEFYRKQAQRFSTFGTPRLVTCFEHDEAELRLPRGLLDEARVVLSDAGFGVDVQAVSDAPSAIDVRFTGELRPEQDEAVQALLRHETGVLVAPPGSGKTVIACALIAARAAPTAILVNRAELLQQWRTRLTEFLSISDKQLGQLGTDAGSAVESWI